MTAATQVIQASKAADSSSSFGGGLGPPPGGAAGPPPPPAQSPPSGGPGGLNSVADLDQGSTAASQVTGNPPPSRDPGTRVEPITPAQQVRPVPQYTEQIIGGPGSHLSQFRAITLRPPGVPGIDEPAASLGNPSLWFATRR